MAKRTCIRLNKDGTYTKKRFKIEDSKIIDGKKDKVDFTPLCVFPAAPEHFSKWKFWKWFKSNPALIFFVQGGLKALSFIKGDESLIQTYWSKKEAQNFVHKMIALESLSVKPLKLYQFLILLVVNMAGVAGVFYLIMKLAALG